MALSATLAELETWIRQDADMQAPDDRVTSEECRNRINRSLAQLYDRLVLVDQEYFLKGVTVASNGSGKYDIQNDFATGVVRSINSVYAGGAGYANGSTVTLSQGANATATGTVTSTGGVITGITLTNGGFGYVDAPLSQAAWVLQSSTPFTPPSITGAPLVIGGFVYFVVNDVATNNNYVYSYDTATQAVLQSGNLGSGVRAILAHDDVNATLVAVTSSGNLVLVDPVTLADTVVSTLLPAITNEAVVCDDQQPARELYVADGTNVRQLDIAGAITNTAALGFSAALLGKRVAGAVTYLILQDTTTDDLYEQAVPALGPPVLLSSSIGMSVASVVYVASANLLYIQGATQAFVYNYTANTTQNITSQLAAPGYVYGPGFVTYDAADDRVWFGAFVTPLASTSVVSLDAATTTLVDVVPYTGDNALWALIVGSTLVVSATLAIFPAGGNTLYSFAYSSVPVSVPNLVLLNVSGGVGGQVVAYIESDFYKCKGVWFTDGDGTEPDNGNWCPLRRFSWEQQNVLNQSALYDGLRALPLYRIVTEGTRDKVFISPDQLAGSYKLWYYPAPPRLLTDTDRFDGRAGWDEWIVKDVAIQLLMAEESVEQAATLKNVRDEIWQRIQLHAEDREAAQPQRIMDATLLSRRYGPRWGR